MKIGLKNWFKITCFKGLKTFISTFLSSMSFTGIDVEGLNWKTCLIVSLGSFVTCIAMYIAMLCWEIKNGKFYIYARLEDETEKDKKIENIISDNVNICENLKGDDDVKQV